MNLSRRSGDLRPARPLALQSMGFGVLIWLGAGMAAMALPVAQTIPFSNNFNYAAGTTVQSLTNAGWEASDATVQVQTNVVCADIASVVLPPKTALTNWVTGAMTNVWTDLYVQMEPRDFTNNAATASNAILQLYLDRSGYVQVYDRQNGWLILSNTVRGTAVSAFTNGHWGRVTLFQNYATFQCAIFLDGTLIKELLPFVSNVTACSRFRALSGDAANSYLDNFSMTRVPPADLPDAAEIDAYGYVALTNHVGPSQTYTTIQSAVAAALPRYVIDVASGTYNEDVTITHAFAALTGGAFTLNGTLAIASGLTITSAAGFTASNLTLGSSVTMAITNATVAVSNLSIGVGARLVLVNGTVTANGMTLSGSFTLDENWGNQGASALLPYSDNFEPYPAGTPMNALGFRGWGASDSGVAVERGTYVSASNGVSLGFYRTLSNRVNTAASQVWTDLRVIPSYDVNDVTTAVRSTAAFMAVMSTNGYLSLYNRTNATWEECRKDAWRRDLPRQTGQWLRVSVLCDYGKGTCGVFLDSTLVRQEFPFINPALTSNSTFSLINRETNAVCLDDVYLGATYPPSLTNDVNNNGVPDAQEILLTDDIFRCGTIFKFR